MRVLISLLIIGRKPQATIDTPRWWEFATARRYIPISRPAMDDIEGYRLPNCRPRLQFIPSGRRTSNYSGEIAITTDVKAVVNGASRDEVTRMNESKELRTTPQKARTINFDAPMYGTFAEIGAGQEV